MATIGSITPACFCDPLPALAVGAHAALTEPGMADQSTLFFPRRFAEARIRVVITGGAVAELDSRRTALEALRKTKVTVNDEIRSVTNVLIVAVVELGPPFPCVAIVGGTDADDIWEQELGVLMQLPSPDLA